MPSFEPTVAVVRLSPTKSANQNQLLESESAREHEAAESARFLSIAMGSAGEPECHLLLPRDLEVPAKADYERLDGDVTEVRRMLTSLIHKLYADC
ncbi:MAG: four helix bundle protein [Acidobacteria bacterium]|nr:four helix bundle protein [Acidobacteriota bacterium]